VIFSGRSGHGLVLSAANFAANKATSDCSRLHLTALLADSVTAAKSTFWQVNHDSRIMAQVYFNPSIAHQALSHFRACFRRAVWRFVGDILAIVPTRDCTRLHERRRAERLTTAGSDGRAVAGCRDRGTASATECRGSDRRRRRCPNRGRSNTYESASPSFRRASLGRVVRVKAYVVARHVGEVGGGQRATDPALQAVDAQVDERYGWCGVAQNR